MISTLALSVTILGTLWSQTEVFNESPTFPHTVALDISLQRSEFEIREPVIARVTLTNLGEQPFRLDIRDDGAPLRVTFQVAALNASYSNHSLWLKRNGPEPRQIELAPGESTSGDILVLLDYGKGYVFASPGWYSVRCRWFGKIYSDEVTVTVRSSSRVDEDFLRKLELIALQYHVGEVEDTEALNTPEGKKALEREGGLLLAKVINQDSPYRVDSEDHREAVLADALTKLLERYPDSSYSAYLARYLAFMHLASAADKLSLAKYAVREKTDPSTWNASACLADPSYQKALRYLTMADKADLWPRTTAVAYLAWLYMIPQDWEKVNKCCDTLRTKYPELGGPRLADDLERGMEKYQSKITRWKEKHEPDEGG